MNDEYRGDGSGNEGPSRTAGAGTATAEPVDRRWFEEALRAQGFLVEPPVLDPSRQDAVDSDPRVEADAHDDEPPAVESEHVPAAEAPAEPDATILFAEPEPEPEPDAPFGAEVGRDLAIAEAQAVIESDGPAASEGEFVAHPPVIAGPEPPLEPWDLPIQAPSVAAADTEADAEPSPGSGDALWWAAAEPVATPHAPWPALGTTPSRLESAPANAPSRQTVVLTARQAVQPTTLPPDVLPVPTAALAARLSRSSITAAPASAAPASAAPAVREPPPAPSAVGDSTAEPPGVVEATADTPAALQVSAWPYDDAGPAVVSASATPAPATVDPWTLPALRADLAADRLAESTPANVSTPGTYAQTQQTPVAPSQPVTAAATLVVDPAVAQFEPVPPTEPVTPTEPSGPRAESSGTQADATASLIQPTAPFSPPTAGIADIARRPASPTVGTSVDGGDSDLWGLVGDPTKASSAVGAAPKSRSFSATSMLLTIFVAIVVVALVLGFLVLFTSLL